MLNKLLDITLKNTFKNFKVYEIEFITECYWLANTFNNFSHSAYLKCLRLMAFSTAVAFLTMMKNSQNSLLQFLKSY